MRTRPAKVLAVLLLLVCSAEALGREWGIGISSEPMDIRGGGFFLDSYIDMPLLQRARGMKLGLRGSLGVGPLPIDPRIVFLDVMAVGWVPLGNMSAYAGAGPSYMVATDFDWTQLDGLVVVGVGNIRITESVEVYIEVKVRGTGFFVSPGVGFVLHL